MRKEVEVRTDDPIRRSGGDPSPIFFAVIVGIVILLVMKHLKF